MRKILTYFGVIGMSSFDIVAFLTSKSYLQLGTAVAVYLFLVYCTYRLFIRKNKKAMIQPVQTPEMKTDEKYESEDTVKKVKDEPTVIDFDKRAFLKLIGATGISFFLLSLFNRKAGTTLFGEGSTPGTTVIADPAGNKIVPAQHQPTDSYIISEIDEGEMTYYGFTDPNSAWFIMREDLSGGKFRYARGEANFQYGWINRKNLDYDFYFNVFKYE